MLASVVEVTSQIIFNIEGQSIPVESFLVDHALYQLEINNKDEALFLTSMLNSPAIDRFLQPFRRRGQKARPNVHKKIFDVANIPQFDATNHTHRCLAELGQECSAKVKSWLEGGGPGKIRSIDKLRGMVRAMLKRELGEIDKLVENILV